MNRKGVSLKIFPIAILVFSMVIVGFYVTAGNTNTISMWNAYGYAPPSNNLTSYNKINELSQQAEDLSCDINPESEACADRKINPLFDNFIGRMVQGAYGGLITLYKAFSLPKELIISVGQQIGIPAIFITVGYTAMLLIIVLSVIYMIFLRSDS